LVGTGATAYVLVGAARRDVAWRRRSVRERWEASVGIAEECARQAAGLTVPALLHRNAVEHGERPALTLLGSDQTLTWRGLRDEVAAWARGLAAVGLRGADRMLIMVSPRPEHWFADLAAAHLGAVPCTAYDTLSPSQLRFLAQHSKAPVVVLEGAEQVARWLPILDEVPDVHTFLVLDEAAIPAGDQRFRAAREVVEAGRAAQAADPGVFEETWRRVRPEQPVCLLYTSGTTGDPKGVVLSHYNVIYQAVELSRLIVTPDHSPTVSYLPLAHVAERLLGIYIPLHRANHVHICANPAQLVSALAAVRPIGFFGVPRVWEKMVAGLRGIVDAMPAEERAAFEAAHALRVAAYKLRVGGQAVPDELAERVAETDRVLLPIRRMFGLDRVIGPGSGAAPIPVDILYTLAGLGIEVLEVWGMTETTGTATSNTHAAFRPGTVGRPAIGMEIRLADDGEVLVRGPMICLGYLQPDGSVEDQTDADGWLATGDVGVLDGDGYLSITDRKKELIITSSGKNIPPARIENLLRAHPLIAQAVAVGDRRSYVTALIALDPESVPVWAKLHGVEAAEPTDLAALAAHPAVRAEIESAVEAANTQLARIEQVKRFAILPAPWSPETGELTPTLKLRRRIITERYAPEIEKLYGSPV
jgi:long-chain acyl-CoA synthetase